MTKFIEQLNYGCIQFFLRKLIAPALIKLLDK